MRVPSKVWPLFYDVTPELVCAFEKEAYAHIKHVLDNTIEFGFLYMMAGYSQYYINAVYFDVDAFQLARARCKVIKEVKKQASRFKAEGTNGFNATCLYLLYFYTLLANPHANWIMIDYLTGGNRYHQYGTRLDWAPPPGCVDTRGRDY
ncbi:uncharacterized protein CDAR_596511 [Caerostris darwini]|uniref:Uncharacterized protein n=1 Tax=Caerostris darwini TaxID=1538125 RepID=A0AAV4QPT6_9ARAC|nr:uncharacterized protein CDAR_596511 [Caerostris darwini]